MTGRPKLGIALSGGGFRASFFHLGVLRRLAELDLLRHISVFSTVSGGSIVGGLYLIHLARLLEKTPKIARSDYVTMVGEVQKELRAGVATDLRSRLLLDPLQNLRMFCLAFPLGRRLARLLHKRIFAAASARMRAAWAGGIPLEQFRVEPGGKPLGVEIEAYNAGDVDQLPKWVINATCLNSGGTFRFSPSEVGDPVLGSLRFEEAGTVRKYRDLLRSVWTSRAALKVFTAMRDKELAKQGAFRERTSRHAAWWLAVQDGLKAEQAQPADASAGLSAFKARLAALTSTRTLTGVWLDVLLEDDWDASRRLATAEFRLLRRAKLAAWYLRDGSRRNPSVTGGLAPEVHASRLWSAIEDIDMPLARRLSNGAPAQGRGVNELAEFALDLFFLRSAQAFAWTAGPAAARLTVADAVAASASFPPAFAPFRIGELFDPGRVWRLGLTDGGVVDNIGFDSLLEEGCTHIIASDAGQLLEVQGAPAAGRLGAMGRIGNVMMATGQDRQLTALREQRRVTAALTEAAGCDDLLMMDLRERYRLEALVSFAMTSNPNDGAHDGPPPHPFAEDIAAIRTDLDAMHPDEIDALIYQGHQLCDRFVRRYLGTAFPCDMTPAKSQPLGLLSGRALMRTGRNIRAGRSRFFRPFLLRPVLLSLCVMLLLAMLAGLWQYVPFPLSAMGAGMVDAADRFGRWPLLVGGYELIVDHPRSGWVALIGLLGLLWLWIRWPAFEMALSRGLAPYTPRLLHVAMTRAASLLGLWRRNVWWLLGFAPAVLSIVASAWAAGTWLFGRLARRG